MCLEAMRRMLTNHYRLVHMVLQQMAWLHIDGGNVLPTPCLNGIACINTRYAICLKTYNTRTVYRLVHNPPTHASLACGHLVGCSLFTKLIRPGASLFPMTNLREKHIASSTSIFCMQKFYRISMRKIKLFIFTAHVCALVITTLWCAHPY